jgi:tetratricopeptide (TPR) repeat protein
LEECIQIGLRLTEALAHMHRQGLVHRDVKPSNIIFVGGMPKLADVGLVAAVDEARSFVGTEGFIPPEGPGTPQADLYSLGIVLYVLSTGKSHQDFPEPAAELRAAANHTQWLEFDAVVHKACQANARERFQSAEAMHEELALLAGGQSVRQKRVVQRRWAVATKVGLVAISVALLALAWPLLRGPKRGHIPDPQALKLYEDGRWQYSQLTTEAHVKALDLLTKATQRDPKFVQPYGELTALYVWYILPGTNSQERLERTKELAAKAMAVDPKSAEAHVALSFCHFLERDWRGAESEIVRAIRRNPNLALAHDLYAFYLACLERFDESHREAQRAEALEPPGSLRVTAIVGAFPYIAERRLDRAIAQLQQVLELDKRFSEGLFYLGLCYEGQSNYLAAIDAYEAEAKWSGQQSPWVTAAFAALRQAYATGGERGYLQKWVELIRTDESRPDEEQVFGNTGSDLAGYYARLGEKEKALDELEKHFDEPNVWQQVKFFPLHDPLRGDPRFQALVKRAGLPP